MSVPQRDTMVDSMRRLASRVESRLGHIRELASEMARHRRLHNQAAATVKAWEELRRHPHLQWTPPLWRAVPNGEGDAGRDRRWYAVDEALKITIVNDGDEPLVRLVISQLKDREVDGRVDPTSPRTEPDPHLQAEGPTFEQAVVALRDAVIDTYGPVPSEDATGAPAVARKKRPGARPRHHVTGKKNLAGTGA